MTMIRQNGEFHHDNSSYVSKNKQSKACFLFAHVKLTNCMQVKKKAGLFHQLSESMRMSLLTIDRHYQPV